MVTAGALSDWEIEEMAMLRQQGWSIPRLAMWYSLSERTVMRYLRRIEADSGYARRDLVDCP